MLKFFDKLGLSPQERRLVVIVGIVVFIVVNWWVIIPMFGSWGKYEEDIRKANLEKTKFENEIRRKGEYGSKLKELQKRGSQVATEEAALLLQQEVISQANLTGLGYGTITPGNRNLASTTKTNAFFDEASVNMQVNTGEKELIDFLVRLADRDLLIRAKSMDIGPDPSQMRLQGNLTLVKSFQRKVPVRASSSPAATPPAAKSNPPPVSPAATRPPPVATPAPTTVTPTNTPPSSPRQLPKPMKQP